MSLIGATESHRVSFLTGPKMRLEVRLSFTASVVMRRANRRGPSRRGIRQAIRVGRIDCWHLGYTPAELKNDVIERNGKASLSPVGNDFIDVPRCLQFGRSHFKFFGSDA